MPPEFRARIDDDLDQALQAFMEQEGIPKRADAGRRLMELGLAAAGLEPGEQLTMEQALGHLDRAMHVFTVPLVPRGFPSVHESAVVIPAEPKNAERDNRSFELSTTLRPVSGFILVGLHYEPISVSGKIVLDQLNVLGDVSLLPYEGEHDLTTWQNWSLPEMNLDGKPLERKSANQASLRQLAVVRAGTPVQARVRHYGVGPVSFRLHLIAAPLSHWRSYSWGLRHEAERIVETHRIFEEQLKRVEQHYGSTPGVLDTVGLPGEYRG
jgi:hypothetical protein